MFSILIFSSTHQPARLFNVSTITKVYASRMKWVFRWRIEEIKKKRTATIPLLSESDSIELLQRGVKALTQKCNLLRQIHPYKPAGL